MHRSAVRWLLPALLSLNFTLTGLSADPARVIRLRADSWMPYNGEPAAALPGYAVEIARVIFEAKGYIIDYQTMPWADAIKAAEANEIEGVIGANPKEGKGLILSGEKIGEPVFGLFVRNDSTWNFGGMSSLSKVRLGVIEGYSYWDSLDAYISRQGPPQLTVMHGSTPLVDAIKLLDKGDLDTIVESQSVWLWTVKISGRSNKDYHSVYLNPGDPIYFAFGSLQGKELSKVFDEGMIKLRASGQLATILKKYSLPDWQ